MESLIGLEINMPVLDCIMCYQMRHSGKSDPEIMRFRDSEISIPLNANDGSFSLFVWKVNVSIGSLR